MSGLNFAIWLVLTSLGFRFLTVESIRCLQWNWQDKVASPCLQQKPPLHHPLHWVIKWRRTLHFLGAICPGAKANGLLTPRQALGLRVVSHCQPALISSYNSWRDTCHTVTQWSPYRWKCTWLTNTFTGRSTESNYSVFLTWRQLFTHNHCYSTHYFFEPCATQYSHQLSKLHTCPFAFLI